VKNASVPLTSGKDRHDYHNYTWWVIDKDDVMMII